MLYAMVFAAAVWGQTAPGPRFEVASVKPATAGPGPGRGMISGGPGGGDPTRITADRVTLARLIYVAYDVPFDQISGPSWLQQEFYDIAARVPEGATKDAVKLMWQNLLADRFGIVLHREPKEFPVYELTVAKGGAKLKTTAYPDAKPAKPGDYPVPPVLDADGFPVIPPAVAGTQSAGENGVALITYQSQELASLVMSLGVRLGSITGPNTWAPGRIVDKTGLTGKYDFHLRIAGALGIGSALEAQQSVAATAGPEGMLDVNDPGGGPDLFTALEKQLGLTLTKTKTMIDMLVIDHALRTPTEN
jgi:uncharacterized protein (TIGR03435 family)